MSYIIPNLSFRETGKCSSGRFCIRAIVEKICKADAVVFGTPVCFDGAEIKGFLRAGGVYEPDAVKKTKFMKTAFDLGTRI